MRWEGPGIEVGAGEGLSHAVVRSTVRDISYVTLVLKATLEMVSGGAARVVTPEPVVESDGTSTVSEVAPFLAHAAILLRGTPNGASAPCNVRLAVIGSRGALVDKSVRVVPNEQGFAAFGPIAPSRPARAQFLFAGSPPEARDGIIDLGAGIDARFFNPAPTDQQTSFLEGTETILLEGAGNGRVATHLGGVGVSIVQKMVAAGTDGPGSASSLRPLLDMLIIDAGEQRLSLVWRVIAPAPRDAERVLFEAALKTAQPPSAKAGAKRVAKTEQLTVMPVPGSALPFGPLRSDPPPVPTAAVAPLPNASRKKQDFQTLAAVALQPDVKAMPFLESPLQQESGAFPVVPATPYDAAFSPISVRPAAAGLSATVVLTPDQEEKLGRLLKAPDTVENHDVAAPPPSVDEPSSEPPPTELAPVSDGAVDDRGDARRALLLARLREGGMPRDMDLAGADLSDLDLTGKSFSGSKLEAADLSRCILKEANLAGVGLRRVKLQKAVLDGADLTRAILSGASLDEASLAGANASQADFTGATAKNASFAGAQCERAKFGGASFDNAAMANANLSESDWTKAHATGADFTNAKLVRARLVQLDANGAAFTGADLSRADAERAELVKAVLDDITGVEANFEQARLIEARFDRARLAGARFSRATVDAASFVEADLGGADLSKCSGPGAKLTGALLEGANLKQAAFSKADFSNAKLARANLARGDLAHATFDGADLTGVDGRDARLGSASLSGANLTAADFRDADLTGARMTDAVTTDTKLKGAKR